RRSTKASPPRATTRTTTWRTASCRPWRSTASGSATSRRFPRDWRRRINASGPPMIPPAGRENSRMGPVASGRADGAEAREHGVEVGEVDVAVEIEVRLHNLAQVAIPREDRVEVREVDREVAVDVAGARAERRRDDDRLGVVGEPHQHADLTQLAHARARAGLGAGAQRGLELRHRLDLAADRHGLPRAEEQGRRSAVARDPERPVVVAVDAGPRETGPEEHTPVIQDLHAGWRGVAEDHAVRE